MSIISLSEALTFLDIIEPTPGPGNVSVPNGTYTFAQLETALASALNQFNDPTPTGVIYLSGTYDVDTDEHTIDDTSDGVLKYDYALSSSTYTITFTHTAGVQTIATTDLDPDDVVQDILDAVDQYVKNYCRKSFESASFREFKDGDGRNFVLLKEYPITDITRVAIGRRDAFRVRNTNTTTTASATCTRTGLVLTRNGTADSTCLFATYTTLTTLAAAVSALSGWEGEVSSSEYASYLSTDLLEKYGLRCIDNNWVYFQIPETGEDDFQVDLDAGILTLTANSSRGTKNVMVEYTAGYSSATMPEDLKSAVKIIVKDWYEKRNESGFNLSSYSIGGVSKTYLEHIPREAKKILDSYRRVKF